MYKDDIMKCCNFKSYEIPVSTRSTIVIHYCIFDENKKKIITIDLELIENLICIDDLKDDEERENLMTCNNLSFQFLQTIFLSPI